MKPVLLLILGLSLVGQTTAKELSKKVVDYLTYVTGDTNNTVQYELNKHDYDLMQVRVRRVYVPWLEPQVVGIVEKTVNGKVIYINLSVVSEGPANKVTLRLYNFTDSSGIKSYDPDKISQIKKEHLQGEENCVASYEIWGEGLMTGVIPECRYGTNGIYPSLFITYNCEFETVLYPFKTDQKQPIGPYVFHKTPGEPQPDAPKDYINPCDK